ncbi:MAG: pyridoxal phosphate-dependent aminotransferase [Clostridia bacterium]|nr:pyridoxal phosphate-dependent aminotransferase [Clostridia bacterium]
MKYDFDKLTDRVGSGSLKWDVSEGELPMWVADMDFEAPPAVRRAIERRASLGIYGYATLSDDFFSAVRDFRLRRHGIEEDISSMVYSNGIVAAISSMVRRLTEPNENVLFLTPSFNLFFNSTVNNGRKPLTSDLVLRDGEYFIDFDDLEEKLSDPQTSLMIFCNPHNPVGRIWTREELSRVGALARKHGVTVISDEIHCDLTDPRAERRFIPFAAADEDCRRSVITCVAASKSFNLAGLQSACLIINDPHLRHKVWRGINTDEVGEPNIFAVSANIAAFTECDEWLDELREYLFENRRVAEEFIKERLPRLNAIHGEATYLMWIDVSAYTDDSTSFTEKIRALTGLYLSEGREYGECGRYFVRMNLATQRARLLDGLSRLERAIREMEEG